MPMGPTAICNNNNNNNNSRRKQAKPQRLIANGVDESVPVDDAVFLTKNAGNGGNKMEVDDAHTGTDPQPSSISPPSTSTGASQSSPAVTNSSSSSSSSSPPIDCHVCGNCSQQFDDVGDFVDHKKLCHRRDEMTPPMVSEVVSSTKKTLLPIDLSSKKNGLLIESGTTTNNEFDYAAFQHHQQLLDFYAKFAQQQQPSVTSSSSSSSSDLLLSPPTSNDPIDLHHHHHVCSVDDQQFRSRAALLWHTLRQHPDDGRLQCDRCERRFVDGDDLQMHRCDDRRRPTRALSVDGADAEEAEDGRRNYCCVSRSSLPDRLNTQFQLVAASTAPPMVPAFDLQKQQQMLAVFDLPLDLTQQCNVIRQLSPPPPRPPPMTIDCQPPPLPPPPIYRPPPPTSASSSSLALANDDDWESLMEVSQTDEAEKIRALVGDKALPTTDPNQCLLCRRVLSCKSALQMHYRTHTGERPFKCKICQRAFTTKGNLKTHMGVHRAKHPFRNNTSGNTTTTIGQHQCPICQKRLVSGVQLQQHIAQVHTHQLTTRNSADGGGGAIAVASSPPRSDQQLMNQLFAVGLPPPPPAAPFPLPVTSSTSAAAAYAAFSSMFAASIPPPPMIMMPTPFNATQSSSILPQPTAPSSPPPPSTTTTTCNICYKSFACYSALEIHYRDCCRSHTKDRPYKCGECSRAFSTKGNMKQHALTHRQQQQQPSDADHDMHHSSTPEGSVDESNDAPHRSLATSVSVGSIIDCAESESEKVDELDEDDKLMVVADDDQHDDPNPLDAIQKMWAQTVPPPPRQVPILSKHQCGVCFKHFSSSSALQIHLRTHSGEKPFKCHICDRAFTTRGNLKVHMGTHAWQNPSRRGRRIFEFSPPPSGSSVDNSTTAQQPPLNYFQAPETSSNASSTSSTSSSIDKLFNSHPAPFCFPLPGCFGGGASASTPNMEAMMWMWRTVCSVCQKVCASPAELEDHLKLHLQQHHTNTASSSSMFRC